jgi:hypothetical protein
MITVRANGGAVWKIENNTIGNLFGFRRYYRNVLL